MIDNGINCNVASNNSVFCLYPAAAGPPPNRRGRGGGHRGRGRFNVRRDGPVKFEKDFDFESANAQFNKEEIDREFQSKLKLKGTAWLSNAFKIFDSKNLIGGGQRM